MYRSARFLLTFFWSVAWLPVVCATVFSANAAPVIAERDLAVILPTDDEALKIKASDIGFSYQWMEQISKAFEQTSVGPALVTENQFSDWQLVSLRFDPCQSLISRPHTLAEQLCWPEVRLVLQPIVRNVRALGRIIPFYADDRAVHVLFDYNQQRMQVFQPFITKALASIDSGQAVDALELQNFVAARQEIVRKFMLDVFDLRDASLKSSEYLGLDLRPEVALNEDQRAQFKKRLVGFLTQVNYDSHIPKEITAFSLPEGREPAHIDEWIFLQFVPQSPTGLQQKVLTIRSSSTSKVLLETGFAQRASMARDDEKVYEGLEKWRTTPFLQEIEENLVLFLGDAEKNAKRIADERLVRVPNTSCASCHKLNQERFDLHNLSYLEERSVTISPRVRQDVDYDLAWLRKFL